MTTDYSDLFHSLSQGCMSAFLDAGITNMHIRSSSSEALACCKQYLPRTKTTHQNDWNILGVENNELFDFLTHHYYGYPASLIKPHPRTSYRILNIQQGASPLILSFSLDGKLIYLLQNRKVIIVTHANGLDLSRALLYLMRDIVLHEKDVSQGMIFHASCTAIGDDGIIFLGNKGAGKTTCAILSLLEDQAKYISNDRTVITIQSDKAICSCFPIAAKLNADTIALLKAAERIRVPSAFSNTENDNKIAFPPEALAKQHSFQLGACAKLKYIVFPRYQSKIKPVLSKLPCNKELIIQRLNEYSLDNSDPAWRYSWITRALNQQSLTGKRNTLETIAGLPAYDMTCSTIEDAKSLIQTIISQDGLLKI